MIMLVQDKKGPPSDQLRHHGDVVTVTVVIGAFQSFVLFG